jgi:hypothetical protein
VAGRRMVRPVYPSSGNTRWHLRFVPGAEVGNRRHRRLGLLWKRFPTEASMQVELPEQIPPIETALLKGRSNGK